MSPRISLWAGLIGIGATMPLVQTIAVAQTSVEISDTATAITRSNKDANLQSRQLTAIAKSTGLNADDYIRSAVQNERKRHYRRALADYNQAIQINPNSELAYYNRGLLKYAKFQALQGALVDFDRAIELDPNDAVACGNRGVLKHDRLKDRSGGIADLQQAAQLFQQQGNTKDYQTAIDLLKKWQQ